MYNLIKRKKIFIPGGAGFIGSWLCERLVKNNEVFVYDNKHRYALNYTDLMKNSNFHFIKGDILNKKLLEQSVGKCNMIINLAAIAGIDSVVIRPIQTMRINLIGAYNLLEIASKRKIDLFITFSTSEVYGPFIYRADEKDMTTQGEVGILRWTYSVSKLATEHLTYCYFKEYKLPIVIVRPFNVYGPRQVGEGAVQKFILSALKNEDLVIYGDGNQIRAWCYIDDFTEAMLLIMNNKQSIGEVFNIGNPKSTITVLSLAEKIIKLSNSSSKIIFRQHDYPDVEIRVPSIHKIETLLGYKPRIGIEEGIIRTIEWYRKNWDR